MQHLRYQPWSTADNSRLIEIQLQSTNFLSSRASRKTGNATDLPPPRTNPQDITPFFAAYVGRLGSGPRIEGRIGSGVWVSANFQKKIPPGSVLHQPKGAKTYRVLSGGLTFDWKAKRAENRSSVGWGHTVRPARAVTVDWRRHADDWMWLGRGRRRRSGHVRQRPAHVTDDRRPSQLSVVSVKQDGKLLSRPLNH